MNTTTKIKGQAIFLENGIEISRGFCFGDPEGFTHYITKFAHAIVRIEFTK